MLAALDAVQVGDVRRLAAGDRGQHLLQRVVVVAVELRRHGDVGMRSVELRRELLDRRRLGVGVALPHGDVDVAVGDRRGRAGSGPGSAGVARARRPCRYCPQAAKTAVLRTANTHPRFMILQSAHGSTTDRVRFAGRSGPARGPGRARRPSAGSSPAPPSGRPRRRTTVAPAARTSSTSAGLGVAEEPHERARPGDADRTVAVLHSGIGLGPRAGRLAALQRRFGGQPDRPAAAEEHEVLILGGIDGQRGARAVSASAIAGSSSWPKCARRSASTVVANRV